MLRLERSSRFQCHNIASGFLNDLGCDALKSLGEEQGFTGCHAVGGQALRHDSDTPSVVADIRGIAFKREFTKQLTSSHSKGRSKSIGFEGVNRAPIVVITTDDGFTPGQAVA